MSEPDVPRDDAPPIRRAGEGYRFDAHGWTYLHIEDEADERGFQHGQLMARELGEIVGMLRHVVFFDTGKPWDFFTEAAEKLFAHHLDNELGDEIRGIADGARQAGVAIDWRDVLAWNGYEELLESWWPSAPRSKGRCSAFLAHDHHDVHLEQRGEPAAEKPSARTICGHYELDAREWVGDPERPLPFQPRGTLDGKVCDSAMAHALAFEARWGTSCGRAFEAEAFLAAHPQWDHLEGHLHDRPTRPWARFGAGQEDSG